jgi:S-DNA-T family DNA segregation ATPase FtsK/SpoIIIE
VNVITGIIKANLPSRIAFKVASKVDSRTILDVGGADTLIGKGDMLFIPTGASQLIRAQGAWVSDGEINHLVEFLKCNGAPQFAEDVQQMVNSEPDAAANENQNEDPSCEADELLSEALRVLKGADRVSTSLLQRRLKIGYNRAARIMETLESQGLIHQEER